MVVTAAAVTALDEVLSRKEMQVLKTPLCGYRTFADFLDATPYEHFHPTFPSALCEPPKLRSVLYATPSRSPRRPRRPRTHTVRPPARPGAHG